MTSAKHSMGQVIAGLTASILAARDFFALLPDTLEYLSHQFDCDVVGACFFTGGQRVEYGFDRKTGGGGRMHQLPWVQPFAPGVVGSTWINDGHPEHNRIAHVGLDTAVRVAAPIDGPDVLYFLVGWEETRMTDAQLERHIAATAGTLAVGASRHTFQQQALFDPITGLHNRRYMDAAFPAELARAQRYRTALTVMLLDIDGFKDVNDRLGHAVGDEALRGIGEILSSSVRSCDTAVRYGGDEFVLVLPATRLEGARQVVDRIQDRLGRFEFSGESVTLSGGVAPATDGVSPEELITNADQLLYDAKEAGRNQILFPNEPIEEFEARRTFRIARN